MMGYYDNLDPRVKRMCEAIDDETYTIWSSKLIKEIFTDFQKESYNCNSSGDDVGVFIKYPILIEENK